MSKISIEHDINVGDLVYQIVEQLDNEQMFKFIKDLDLYAQDWNLTKKLMNHFKNEMKKLDREKGYKNTQEKK